jgi:hypothetical protein
VRAVNCSGDGCGDDPDTATVDESANDDYGDLRLQATAPAIDAADNAADLDGSGSGTATIAGVASDQAGAPRIVAVKQLPATVDMGAYERANGAPTAHAGGPYAGSEGSPVSLDGSASSDEGVLATYAWDCTDDGSVEATSASPTGSSCLYPDGGAFSLRLAVTDTIGAAGSATATATIANVPPTYTAGPSQSAVAGSANSFTLGSFHLGQL